MNLFLFSQRRAVLGLLVAGALISSTACSRKVQVADDTAPESTPMSADEKIAALSDSLSKAQNRIEELDARLSAMSDRLDNAKNTEKSAKTEVLPGAAEANPASSDAADAPAEAGQNTAPSHSPAQNEIISSFTNAMSLFKANKFSDSELEFHKFTENFPDHILAGSAQFYAGESYFMMGEYKLAANEYHKVLASFGSSPRLASAMVRLAQCQKMNGKEGDASRTFSVAYNLFQGNPSLDYRVPEGASRPSSSPAATAPETTAVREESSSASKLDAGPIEHASPASAETNSTGSASNEIQD